jgi:Zn-dependent protease
MDTEPRIVGHFWETPVLVRGVTWLPVAQLATFLVMFWYAKQRSPERPIGQRLCIAGMTTAAILGSEWAHNMSHLVVAHAIHKPMDEFQILLGMPRCIYFDLDDPDVTPRQHIQRSLAGPLLNTGLLPLLIHLRRSSVPGSLARELWDTAVGMNIFLATVSLLPIPGIDGGPILKWSLVEGGYSPQEADQTVRRVNGPLAAILGIGALLAYLRRKRFLALLLGLLSGSALGVFLGWIKESDILQSTKTGREDIP